MDAMTKGQRNLLLFLLGVVILVVPIRFVALNNFEDRKELVSKKDEQQVYYNSLKAKDVNRDQYIKDTENYKKEYEAILAEFPSEIYQENTIMYLQGIKDEYKFRFTDVTMGEEQLFYTLGTGAVGDATLDGAAAGTAATDANATTAATTETAAAGTDATVAVPGENNFNCYSANFPVSYAGSYQSIKDVVDYIEKSDYRMTVDSVSIAFDEETGDYTGEMAFSEYAVTGGDRTTDQVNVNVQTGKDNIFGNPTVKSSTTSTTTSNNQ